MTQTLPLAAVLPLVAPVVQVALEVAPPPPDPLPEPLPDPIDRPDTGRPHACGKYCVSGPLLDSDGRETGEIGVARVYCGQFRCPACGPRKRRKVFRAMAQAAQRHHLTRFFTFTLDPKLVEGSGLEPHAYVQRCFQRLRARWAKRYGRRGVQYLKVVEHQENGMPHLHLLASRYIPQTLLKSWWEDAGGGWMVWAKHVDEHQGAAYLVKYLSKELYHGPGFPHRVQRYSTSQGIRLFLVKKPKGWVFVRSSIDRVARLLICVRGVVDCWKTELDAEGFLQWLQCPDVVSFDLLPEIMGVS